MTSEQANPYIPHSCNDSDPSKQITCWSIAAVLLLAIGVFLSIQLWNCVVEVALGLGIPIEDWDATIWLCCAAMVGAYFLPQYCAGMLLMLVVYIAVRRRGSQRDLTLAKISLLSLVFYPGMMVFQLLL